MTRRNAASTRPPLRRRFRTPGDRQTVAPSRTIPAMPRRRPSDATTTPAASADIAALHALARRW